MTTAPATVGVVGLGNMGLPMAGHLLAAGFGVRGYDVRPEAVDALARAGGTPAASPAAAVAGAPVAITSLPSVAALQEVVSGERGLASAGPDGLILIETSTLPVAAKAEAAEALARVGAVVLDCPLSGTASQMRARDIAVYASGDPAALKRSQDVLAAFSRVRHEVGAFGNGMRMKLIATTWWPCTTRRRRRLSCSPGGPGSTRRWRCGRCPTGPAAPGCWRSAAR
jgi:3-hydroxyisobutyrate dehydrogenase-like beta-hydroxyacid dehydrogenase